MGPSPNSSILGFNYYISSGDAYSKFTWFYLIKSKVNALSIFKQFKIRVEIQFGFPMKAIHIDPRISSCPLLSF